MKFKSLFVSSLLSLFCLCYAEAVDVSIPDPSLERVIREELGKPTGSITDADLATITRLWAAHERIMDLTGIEYCVNLEELYLYDNYITDLDPLEDLTKLRELSLDENYITDIGPLADLTNLEDLDLSGWDGNNITDISPLEKLTKLVHLDLARNQISDISDLADLTNLRWLGLANNWISDITPLSNLTSLEELYIDDNLISDIGILAGVTNLKELDIADNYISDIGALSSLTNLIILEAASNQISSISGVASLTNLEELSLERNQITNIGALANLTKLRVLGLANNQIASIASLSDLTDLWELYLEGNQITNIAPLANLNNLWELYLENNQITDISPLANLSNLWELNLENNLIASIPPLPNLTNLSSLNLENNRVTSITGLADLANLTYLDLDDNMVSNINPLAGLVKLTGLDLGGNQITNIAPLAGLTYLGALELEENQINNITPLASLVYLTELGLRENPITSIEPLCNLIYLTRLELGECQITDISCLANLIHLVELELGENQITGISPLAGLVSLEQLELSDNQITDISPLTGLVNLEDLELSSNQISDISPLVGNVGLGKGDSVRLRGNPLNEDAYNVHIPALEARGVDVSYSEPDEIPRIEDLAAATGATGNIVDLSWKVPDNVTASCRYIIRYNTSAITQSNWNTSLDVEGEPIPTLPGSTQTMAIAMPNPKVIYYFAIRTRYPDGDLAPVSNSPSAWSAMPSDEGMDLYVGWNMVAFMGDQPISVQEAMSSMNEKYSAVWTYDAHESRWYKYIVEFAGTEADFINDLTQLKPGFAYWISVTQAGKWYFGGTGGMSPSSEMRRPPFLVYGKVYDSTDPENPKLIDPANHGELNIHLRVGRSPAGSYVLGSDPVYRDYYALELPVDGKFHAGDIALMYLDGVLADGDPLTLGSIGEVYRYDVSYMRVPKSTNLLQNYPNPFNPETWIPYQLSEDSEVEIRIYNSAGRLVRTLAPGFRQAGHYITREKAAWWDGANEVGEKAASGVYFYTIRAGKSFAGTRKMVVIQ